MQYHAWAYYIFSYVYMWVVLMYVCAHVCASTCRLHQRVLDPLELELQITVSCQMWVLENELGPQQEQCPVLFSRLHLTQGSNREVIFSTDSMSVYWN